MVDIGNKTLEWKFMGSFFFQSIKSIQERIKMCLICYNPFIYPLINLHSVLTLWPNTLSCTVASLHISVGWDVKAPSQPFFQLFYIHPTTGLCLPMSSPACRINVFFFLSFSSPSHRYSLDLHYTQTLKLASAQEGSRCLWSGEEYVPLEPP